MIRIAWRLQRTGLIGMSAFGVLYGLILATAYNAAAGTTVASRVAFGHQMDSFGRTYSYLLPLPVRVDTVSGYVQWRIYGALPALFGFWALLAASGATRGDEDRGLIEEWLSLPLGRSRYIGTRFVVFASAAAIAVAATSAGIELGVVGSGFSLDLGAVIEDSVALLMLTLTCYGIAMVVAQVGSRRATAAGLGGAVLAVLFLINGFGRTDENLRSLASSRRFTTSNAARP